MTDGLTAAQAADIIGVTPASVYRLVHQGRLPKSVKGQRAGLDLEAVEHASLERFRSRRRGGHPYWATIREAAEILDVSQNRVHQLVGAGRLPAVRHAGTWVFRRQQVEVITNAREARWADARAKSRR